MDEKKLPACVVRVLNEPGVFDLPSSSLPAVAAGSYHGYRDLGQSLVKLWDARLIAPVPTSRLEMFRGCPVRAGLFAVAKKDSDQQRVIVDRRRRNALETSLPDAVWEDCIAHEESLEDTLEAQRLMCFPHGAQFCDLLVDPAHGVRLWCDDASNYYLLLRWPKNALARDTAWRSVSRFCPAEIGSHGP